MSGRFFLTYKIIWPDTLSRNNHFNNDKKNPDN